MSNDFWYVAVEGQQQGPFPLSQLAKMAIGGTLTFQSLVWTPGMPAWAPAGEATRLFQEKPAVAAPAAFTLAKTLRKLFAQPTSVEEARDGVKAGAYSGYALAASQVLAGIFSYASGTDLVSQTALTGEDAIDTLVGGLMLAGLAAGLSYWFRTKPRFIIPLLLGLWFIAEILYRGVFVVCCEPAMQGYFLSGSTKYRRWKPDLSSLVHA
jgi:hypothetical protein